MRRVNKYKKEPERNQKRITQFFTRTQSSDGGTPSTSSTPVLATPTRQPRRPQWSDDGDYTGIEVLTPPPPSPKELVDLLSSSDELDDNDTNGNRNNINIKAESESPRPLGPAAQNEAQPSTSSSLSSSSNTKASNHPPPSILLHPPEENSNDSAKSVFSITSDEILSQVDVDQVVRLSQEKKCEEDEAALILELSPSYSPLNSGDCGDNSSGDEILSQIDIDEVIRSSQSSLNTTNADEDNQEASQSNLSTPDKENRQKVPLSSSSSKTSNQLPIPTTSASTFKSPMKKVSPKSQLTKYSPIRHLNKKKRTSSEASLDTISPKHHLSQSPSPSKYRQSQNPANSQSPTKRRLDFGAASSSSATVIHGQARYFLRNFLTILTEVISDPFHSHLIHKEDHHLVQKFLTLSLDAQHLYVRQFQRKWVWRPINKLNNKNKELPSDLTECCTELTEKGYLDQINAENCGSIEDLLDILDLGKLASLVKKMKLNPVKKTKEAYKESLLSIGKNQKSLTGKNLTFESGAVLRKHALQELGQAFRVSMETKLVFSRLFLLHAPPQYWEVENDQASNQLLIVLLNQMGQMEYPSYKINKCTPVYPTRDHLIRFHDAFTLHSNLVALGEGKAWSEMVELTVEAREALERILGEKETQDHDGGLPTFLRIYTAGSVLTHGLWLGVDAYQKLKRWKEANEGIRFLLGQNSYLGNYRGRWWERLVINSETHLRMGKEQVRQLILEGLRDTKLKEHHRFTLSQRLEKVNGVLEKKSKSKAKVKPKPKPPPPKRKKKVAPKRRSGRRKKVYEDESEDEDETDFEEEDEAVKKVVAVVETDDLDTQVIELEVPPDEQEEEKIGTLFLKHEIKSRTITGEKLDQGPGAMGKSVFISRRDASGGNRMGSVEQFVIDHYLDNEGYTSGIHGEGSTIVTIYGLLFWDVIYHDEISDAFHNKYQPFPLDLHFEDFYERRKALIEEKLQLIRSVLGMEDLIGVVDEIWGKNEKKLSIVNWGMFEGDLERLKGLMRAMGRSMIASFCERLARNYRQYCSGFPDLVVWREERGEGIQGHFEVDGGGIGNCENSCGCSPVEERNDGRVLFVEVKGPGDHLSEKQQLWLDFMKENGIPAEVCLVKAQSNKRIRLCK